MLEIRWSFSSVEQFRVCKIFSKSRIVIVQYPKKNLPVGTARAILKSAGIHQS